MNKEHPQIYWDREIADDCRAMVQLAVREDVLDAGDWTTRALVPNDVPGSARAVARMSGVAAGLAVIPMILEAVDRRLSWCPKCTDGATLQPGDELGRIDGPAAQLLVAERLVLNVLGRLTGIATLTAEYVQAVKGTGARIYDTRKTTPGWRLLEKYAVRCGGGVNHRTGLFDAVLIKDNHLAFGAQSAESAQPTEVAGQRFTPAEAVERARAYVQKNATTDREREMIIEVEVDTLNQLRAVLTAQPDIVLLDNMAPVELKEAVELRDESGADTELEASGGVDLTTVQAIAKSGVERISVGRLTHSAISLDIGLDWA